MELPCEVCGEEAYDPEEQVCKSCGIVYEGITLVEEIGFNKGSYTPSAKKKRNEALTKALDVLGILCHSFSAKQYEKDIAALLKDVYLKECKRKRFASAHLAGACLVYFMEMKNCCIPVREVCAKLSCTMKHIYKFQKIVKKFCLENSRTYSRDTKDNINPSEIDYSEFFEKIRSSAFSILSPLPEEHRGELVDKTIKLIRLAHSCWMVTGRSIEKWIPAAAFLCWKSMNYSKALTLNRFCADYNLDYNVARPKVPEIKAMLLKLGKNIPSGNFVNSANVVLHLNYILENSETLRNDLLTEEHTVEEIDKKEFDMFRKKFSQNALPSTANEVTVKCESLRASDVDISDTEINSYIRTEEQVEFIKSIRESFAGLKSEPDDD